MISYIGGKSRMASWICEYIPNDIETYVEVFGGAFWLYIKGDIDKKPSLKEVVYNDKNRFMANLFECMRDPLKLEHELSKYTSQKKDLFDKFQENLNTIAKQGCYFKLGDFDLAVQYAYCATQVFSGSKILESKFIDLKGKYGSKYDALINRLKKGEIINKLTKITTSEDINYLECIIKHDSSKTFFYIDPPYWKTEDYYSNHDFDRNDHQMLCDMLKQIRGRFALSYYDFPLLEDWLPKDEYLWVAKDFSKAAGAQKGKKQNKGTELLIMNY
jgi:DNA adenine methylase